MKAYSIGVDFGTLSGRAVLVRHADGAEIAASTYTYPHAVMDRTLPDGTVLPPDFALQHPQDYLDVLANTIPAVLAQAGVHAEEIAGIGIDFTACTMLPVKADGTPLCLTPQFASQPHAYVKLWKHHAAQAQADRINALAEERGKKWLSRYGGKISSEWMMPKILETLEKAPEVYAAADRLIEAADWITWTLCGEEHRSACHAGYKAIWHDRDGYPEEFLSALHPGLAGIVGTKIPREAFSVGVKIGEMTEKGASLCGLVPGIAVASANIDAHVALPAVGVTEPGKLLMIMGTSTCHILLGEEEREVPGMCGVVRGGAMPGYLAYEAGQSCVGDHFDWFVKNCVPAAYFAEAEKQGVSIHKILREKAKKLAVGESGLVALDWWNGNRSVLVDADLTGVMLGMTLTTRPEEIYRALLEATAYGTRVIIENFENAGVSVGDLYACGGIAEKDELMMQIYADVTGREIRISGSPQAPALGSAIFGAVAAGAFDSVSEAAARMGKVKDLVYRPNSEAHEMYSRLFAEYLILHDYFGRGANDVMKRLKDIRREVSHA